MDDNNYPSETSTDPSYGGVEEMVQIDLYAV
jgi:hypothetical protein